MLKCPHSEEHDRFRRVRITQSETDRFDKRGDYIDRQTTRENGEPPIICEICGAVVRVDETEEKLNAVYQEAASMFWDSQHDNMTVQEAKELLCKKHGKDIVEKMHKRLDRSREQ